MVYPPRKSPEKIVSSDDAASLSADEPIPLVIVEGFLGGALGAALWGSFEDHLNAGRSLNGRKRRRSIFPSVGPVSSLHDRACELYYCLVGGTVDYGEKHSRNHKHNRYGRVHAKGLFPQWSREYPLHFLGHSVGGPTIIKLQTLLKNGHFGPNAHPDMVLSVTSISAPFRGTQVVYTLGERPDAPPAVRPWSVGATISKGVHILAYLAPLLPRFLDVHADARALAYTDASFWSLVQQIRKSDWAEERDATPFDVTFQAADEREAAGEGEVHPRTFYRSYTSSLSSRSVEVGSTSRLASAVSSLRNFISPLRRLSRDMESFDFRTLHPPPSFLDPSFCSSDSGKDSSTPTSRSNRDDPASSEHRINDGVVPLFSQWHPLPCSATRCRHTESQSSVPEVDLLGKWEPKISPPKPMPGIWEVHSIGSDTHHFSVVPFWLSTSRQKGFWNSVGKWLDAIDVPLDSNHIVHG
ncbi:hypothetical protein HGRIS_008180 [Hohenbuehelia grisea]|uniref:Lipase-like C-terminal domain-containing protein n=1 Tax=Hohenbuehelia grisea TaxID=104357 RepID=A0ABR3J7M3_9AGAR